MAARTYNQYCGVAEALDLVGERWTLLVVRDLIPGPQRFSDLSRRQPAMGTDLLTSRLKRLTEHGLVAKVPLPAPASGSMYELTERGEQIKPLIAELAKLGATWLPSPAKSKRRFDAAWALATIAEHMEQAPTSRGIEVTCDGVTQSLQVNDQGRLEVRYGGLADADVSIEGPTVLALGVLLGHVQPNDAAEVRVDGELKRWTQEIRSVLPAAILAS